MRQIIAHLTDKGFKTFLVLLGCAGLAAFFGDPFLAGIALLIGGFILYDYNRVKTGAGKINDLIRVNPNNIVMVSVAGQSKTVELSCQADIDLPVSLSSPLKETQLRPKQVRRGGHTLELLLSSEISGHYTRDIIGTDIVGPFGLTRKRGSIFFQIDFKVFPRVALALVRAALYLLREGRGGTGDYPIPFKVL